MNAVAELNAELRQADFWLSTIFLNRPDFRPDFHDWVAENPHIYREFDRRALEVAAVRDHYSARTIMEVIRHETVLRQVSGTWKINNVFIPDCARLFILLHPEYKDLFAFREHKAAA